MKDLIKVNVNVSDYKDNYYLLKGRDICLIHKSDCTVIEGDKDEPKAIPYNEKLLIEMWNKRNPSHEYSQEGKTLFWKTAFMVFEDYLKALPHEIPAPEPKGYCIKRTPENAEVLNKWANKYGNGTGTLSWSGGYIFSECVGSNPESMQDTFIHKGFTELFTVEEFFEKVNYKPEPVSKENLHTEPVLIAKAGEKVRIVDFGDKYVADFTLNKQYVLESDLYENGVFDVVADDTGVSNRYTSISQMKFEKVSEEPVKEEIDFIEKPPIGLMPEWRHKELRIQSILEAIYRYKQASKEIPKEWNDEFFELVFGCKIKVKRPLK